ncbi:MAG: thioredoxin [Candidatus Woesearchaeota archaeon]
MIELNSNNFEKETTSGQVIVDFWAEWCGPCKMLGPIYNELSTEMDGIKFAKVNVDENQELSAKAAVRGIPTMVLYRDGKEISRIVGFLPKDQLKSKIEEAFN